MLKSRVTLAPEQPLPFRYSFTCTFTHSLGGYSPFKGDVEGGLSRPHAPFAEMQKEQWAWLKDTVCWGEEMQIFQAGGNSNWQDLGSGFIYKPITEGDNK